MVPQPPPFELVGGRLCLDFTNTVSSYLAPDPGEKLKEYDRLVAFAQQTGAISAKEAHALRRAAASHPEDADRVLGDARRLRRALFDLFDARARGLSADPANLEILNNVLMIARAHQRLVGSGSGYRLEFVAGGAELERPLWPIAESAALLLTDPDVQIGRCESGQQCTWLFVDHSKNHSRRWCSMKDCGNRAKARRHYQRGKGEAAV
jgi:predicted RNA-binding Zn ribbon-like protein